MATPDSMPRLSRNPFLERTGERALVPLARIATNTLSPYETRARFLSSTTASSNSLTDHKRSLTPEAIASVEDACTAKSSSSASVLAGLRFANRGDAHE